MPGTTKGNYQGLVSADRLILRQGLAVVTTISATLIIAYDHPLFRAALREAVSRLLAGATIIEAESGERSMLGTNRATAVKREQPNLRQLGPADSR